MPILIVGFFYTDKDKIVYRFFYQTASANDKILKVFIYFIRTEEL